MTGFEASRREFLRGAAAGAVGAAAVATLGGRLSSVARAATAAAQPPGAVLAGNTIPNLALQPGAYDAGLTQAQADAKFCGIVGRGQHLAITKKFWNPSNYNAGHNDLANYAAFGTTVIFCLMPAFPGTHAERRSLATFLATAKGMGFGPANSYWVLWQEPEVKGKLTAAQYQAGLEYYGPTVNDAGLPLVCDIGTGGGETALHAYGNAAIAAMQHGVQLAGLAQDYYAPQSIKFGLTLDTLSGLADASNLPYGVFEHGCVPSHFTVAQCTNYMNYVRTFMVNRKQAGKPCLPVLYYDGQRNATGAGDLTSPIGQDPSTAQPDFRIALWQQLYDELAGVTCG